MSGTQLKVWIIVAVAAVIILSIMAIGGVIAVYKRYFVAIYYQRAYIDSESNHKRCMLKVYKLLHVASSDSSKTQIYHLTITSDQRLESSHTRFSQTAVMLLNCICFQCK